VTEVFNTSYADVYDALYQDKDYLDECALIERLFRQCGEGPIRRVLDLGCGTGNHAIPLARQGYEVAGVDRSAGMLAHARRKAVKDATAGSIAFHQGDICGIRLEAHFDAVLMMFAVLGYQLTNADVLAALRTARDHLGPGGLLLFDVWYGPAVLRERPSQRVKVVPAADGKVLRIASGTTNPLLHNCAVDYHLWHIADGRPLVETTERHTMRYFFPRELDLFLERAGFAPGRLGAFPHFDSEPSETTWNVLKLAQAVGAA
jgi:SAM-dependent methyltransferase